MISSGKAATKSARQRKPIPTVAPKMVCSVSFLRKWRENFLYFFFSLMRIHELARLSFAFLCRGCRNPVFFSLGEILFLKSELEVTDS